MNKTIEIQEQELRRLLKNEKTVVQALSTYFILNDTDPFNPVYELKPEVTVIAEPGEAFSARGLVIGLANNWKKRSRLKHYKRVVKNHPERIRLVSEGDSWFQHPAIVDTIDHLANWFAIYSLGAAGDVLTNMFRKNEFTPALKAQDARGLLLSGGGNDLLADFGKYLNVYSPGSDPKRLLNEEFFEKVDQILNLFKGIYEEIWLFNSGIKIFTHGYDYVIPLTGKAGRYLGKPMIKNNISDPQERKLLAQTVIDEFNEKMKNLAVQYDNVEFVDVRGTVTKNSWNDEIHPDKDGYQQVALKFQERINTSLRKIT